MSVGGSLAPTGGTTGNPSAATSVAAPSQNAPVATSSPFDPMRMGPQADYSMGFARTFQQPSFYNPFQGYYGVGMGMPYSPFGGFASPFGGYGGGFGSFPQQFGMNPYAQQFRTAPDYNPFTTQLQPPQLGAGLGSLFGGGFNRPFMGGFGPMPVGDQYPANDAAARQQMLREISARQYIG